MTAPERLFRLAAITLFAAVVTAGTAGAATRKAEHSSRHAEHAAMCGGEFMYWHDGKCVDARDMHAKTWMQSVF